ncbi:GntR family transcriptional regulator [Microbacterium lushaniae]|nr:GntR family transcriptional regulator [Microbacterium lushaniae]KAA9156826.1 GntR family transcriptional regulator [Microbacterium lushaniae]
MSPDRARAVSRTSLPSQAEDLIREMILDGTLGAGERLNEVAIAESIGISRGPLREAIKRLSGQGYLTSETHRGAFVKQYTPQEIVDLYELRSALELHALRLAVQRAADDDLQALAQKLSQEYDRLTRHAADAADQREPYVSELDFHEQLVALSGNREIRDQLSHANHKLYLALRPTARTSTREEHAASAHREILERVLARDADGAVELLAAHLADSMSNSLSVLGLSDSSDPIQRSVDT